METMEAITPMIYEDFEVGDRVYCLYDGKYTKGTVTVPRPGTFNAITVDMDSDWQTVVSLTGSFQKNNSFIGCWGKIPDVTKFRDGTLISKLEEDGSRTFARVTELVPGESIRISPSLFPTYYRDYLFTDVAILEDEFRDWEIEG